jgi:RimJ/RimL family protein N-acetyltransferase
VQLYTERLCLRPVGGADLDELFRIYSDPETNIFNPAGPYPDIGYARAVLARWIQHWKIDGFGNWAISYKDEPGKIIGFGGLKVRNFTGIVINNLGYRFETQAWGKGYATEFSRFAVEYGFTHMKLREISATVRANHLASQGVLKKTGLRYVREIQDVDNAPPSLFFTLTHDEWRNTFN